MSLRAYVEPIPLYVSRHTAGGETGSISFPIWFCLVLAVLFIANVLLWGAVGIVTALGVLL